MNSPRQERKRPLSPHLQIYRWQISNTLSILHRATGVGLALGLPVFVAWLWAVAQGGETYECLHGLLSSPLGLLALAGWSWAFFYHLLAGIRHLVWDTGRGFDLPSVHRGGWIVVFGSAALTLLALALAFGV